MVFFAVFGTAVIVVMGWLAVGLLRSPQFSLRHRLVVAPLLLLSTFGGAWFVWGKSVTRDEVTIRVDERRMETRRSWLFGLVSSSQQASFDELASLRIVWLPARSEAKMTALRLRLRDGSEQSLFRVLAQQRDRDAHGALRDHLAGALGVTVEPSKWRWWSW